MHLDLVSVIIPVYNAADTIEKCVRSVANQIYDNVEIIVVNDGSIDDTINRLAECQKLYDALSVYTIKNSGVSVARNIGISKSKGRWIMFLDADDEMVPECVDEAIRIASESTCDTCCFNAMYIQDNKEFQMRDIYPEAIFETGEEKKQLIFALYDEWGEIYTGEYFRAVWGKLLSAEVIKQNNLTFPVGIPLGEDAIFMTQYFSKAQKISISNKFLYKYRVMNSSATRKYQESLMDKQKREYYEDLRVLQEVGVETENISIDFWDRAVAMYIDNEILSNDRIDKKIMRIVAYYQDEVVNYYLLLNNSKGKRAIIRKFLLSKKIYGILAVGAYCWKKIQTHR